MFYHKIEKKFADLEKQFEDLKKSVQPNQTIQLDMEKIKSHIISLRGLVNRKLGSTEPIEEIKKEGILEI